MKRTQKLILSAFYIASTLASHMAWANEAAVQGINAPMTTVIPERRYTVVLSAFLPWGTDRRNTSRQTNMAQMVGDALFDLSMDSMKSNIDIVDYVQLEVEYDKSSDILIERVLRLNEPPDMIISLGQGAKKLTLETGAHQVTSNIADINNVRRNGAEFIGLEREIGLNFPVQDMYCSLESRDKSKVAISYSPGAFVCNDLTYQMAHFSLGASRFQSRITKLMQQNQIKYENQLKALDARLAAELEAEAKRYAEAMYVFNNPTSIAPQTQESTPAVRAPNNSSSAEFRAPNPQAFRPSYNLRQDDSRFSNSHQQDTKYPSLQSTQPTQVGPPAPIKPVDMSQTIRRNIESEKNRARGEFERELARLQRFQRAFSLDKPIPFLFIHVPPSDGVAHKPIYRVEDAVCIPRQDPLPQTGSRGWSEISQAAELTEDSINSLSSDAKKIITRKNRERAQQTTNSNPTGYGLNSSLCDPDNYKDQREFDRSYFDPVTNRQVEIYRQVRPPNRYVFSLSSTQSQAARAENEERYQYANLILKMLKGVDRMQSSTPLAIKNLPFPDLSGSKQFLRGKENLNSLIRELESLQSSRTQIVMRDPTKTYNRRMKKGVDYDERIIPAQISVELSECYREVLRKMISDHESEVRLGNTID